MSVIMSVCLSVSRVQLYQLDIINFLIVTKMGRVSESLKLKLRVAELTQENALLQQALTELNESLRESTRLLLKQTPRPNRPAISADQRMLIAGRHRFKCANPHGDCHLYRLPPYDGSFNESGYELDHVVPFSECCLSSVHQLQPLCPQCHAKKTRIWRAAQSEEEG